jgi:hypothetical protein
MPDPVDRAFRVSGRIFAGYRDQYRARLPRDLRMIARLLLQSTITTAAMGALLFASAGTLHWPSAWVFLASALLGPLCGWWLYRVDPALLAERLVGTSDGSAVPPLVCDTHSHRGAHAARGPAGLCRLCNTRALSPAAWRVVSARITLLCTSRRTG